MVKRRWLIANLKDLAKELIKGKEDTVLYSELLDELRAIADDGGAEVIWIIDWNQRFDSSQWEGLVTKLIPVIERMGIKVMGE